MSADPVGSRAVWTQIIIDAPELVAGDALSVFIDDVLMFDSPAAQYAVTNDVEGAGDPVRGLTQLRCAMLRRDELLARLRATVQLDWATIHFFASVTHEMFRSICDELSVAEAIALSLVTIGVVDDSEVHVFTRNSALADRLGDRHRIDRVRTGPLTDLEYPY